MIIGNSGRWKALDANPRQKLILGVLAIACVFAIGVVIDLAFSDHGTTQEGTESQTMEEASSEPGIGAEEDPSPDDDPATPDAEAGGEDEGSVELAGLSVTGYEMLEGLSDDERDELESAIGAYLALRKVSADAASVSRTPERDQQSLRVWLELPDEGEVSFSWNGTWTVTDSLGSLTIDPTSSEEQDPEPEPVALDDKEGLSAVIGADAASGAASAFEIWCEATGTAVPTASITVDPTASRPSADGETIIFEMSDGTSTWIGTYYLDDGGFTFSLRGE